MSIGSGEFPSNVELHRCKVANSTAGSHIEDDPQGDGGVFNVAGGTQLLLSDSLFIDNYSGNKVFSTRATIKTTRIGWSLFWVVVILDPNSSNFRSCTAICFIEHLEHDIDHRVAF